VVLVDRMYTCSMSPYGNGYLLYFQCKIFYNKIITMRFCDELMCVCVCASSVAACGICGKESLISCHSVPGESLEEAGASGSQDKIVLIIAISRIRMVKGPQRFYAAMGTYMGQPPHNKAMMGVFTIYENFDGIWTSEYLDGVDTPARSETDQSRRPGSRRQRSERSRSWSAAGEDRR
jgi:hypothetical protein